MTEIPEHLLKRSQAARAKAEGREPGEAGGDDAGAAGGQVEKATAAAPATPPKLDKPAAPPPPPPPPPYVEKALRSPRPPWWALSVLVALPLWALMYALLIARPEVAQAEGPLALGEELYSTCAGCHGASGGGGVGPAMAGGAILETFPSAEDHVQWVALGSTGWLDEVGDTYGAQNKPVTPGAMPGFGGSLTEEEVVAVVCFERVQFGGEDPAAIEGIDCTGEGGAAAGGGGDHG